MSVLVTNNAVGYLQVGIDSSSTRLLLKSGQGSRFPAPTSDEDWFYVTVQDEQGNLEVMRGVARDTDTMTVQRGADNTVPLAFPADSLVECRPCAGLFNDKADKETLEKRISELEDALESATQTLNQTLTEFQEVVNQKLVEVDQSLENLGDDLADRVTELEKTVASDESLNAFKQEVANKYLLKTGGTITGSLTVNSGLTVNSEVKANSFAAK